MAGAYSVVIQAVDKVTGKLDAINKKAQAFSAPFKRAQASLSKFGDVSGLTRIGGAFTGIARNASEAFGKISEIITPLGAISSAASVAGMYHMVSAWSAWGRELGYAAQNMGVSAQQLSTMQGSARLLGVSAETATSGMQTLGQTMFDAVGGRAPEAVVMFNTLGISFRKSAREARSVADVLPEVANKIASIKDPFVQARIATELFGGAGVAMLPWLRQGAAGIAQYNKMAAAYLHVTADTVPAANQFAMAQTKLTMAVEGLGNRISTQLSPVISPLLEQLATWIATSPDVQAGIDNVGSAAKQFGDFVKTIDWHKVGADIHGIWDTVDGVAHSFGGWKNVMEALIALKFAGWIGGMVAPARALGRALGLMTTPLGLMLAAGGAGAAAGTYLRKAVPAVDRGIDTAMSWVTGYNPSAALPEANSIPPDQRRAAREAMTYFTGQGWTPAQSAGIVANIQRESKFDPRNVGDSGQAYGLGQWHPDRQAAIAQHFGKPLSQMSRQEQYAAYNWELREGGEQAAGRALATQTDARYAGAVVSRFDERPKDVIGEQIVRAGLADQIADAFTKAATAQGAPLTAPGAPANDTAANGNITIQMQHANAAPAGFSATVVGAGGSLGGARVVQANTTTATP